MSHWTPELSKRLGSNWSSRMSRMLHDIRNGGAIDRPNITTLKSLETRGLVDAEGALTEIGHAVLACYDIDRKG